MDGERETETERECVSLNFVLSAILDEDDYHHVTRAGLVLDDQNDLSISSATH